MKTTILFLLVILFSSCSINHNLDRKIYKNRKQSARISPFNTAKGSIKELKIQKKRYSHFYKNDIDKLLSEHLNDTIIIVESYSVLCSGCPATIDIYVNDMLITYNTPDNTDKDFIKTEISRTSPYKYFYDIEELEVEISKNPTWYKNPSKYGTDDCHDGSDSFYTVLYPSGKIESMHMRCWIPKDMRDK